MNFKTRRWMLQHSLGLLVPFHFVQDNYMNNVQTLYVWRYGRLTIEKYKWSEYKDVDLLDRLKVIGISNRQLYSVIQSEASLLSKEEKERQ